MVVLGEKWLFSSKSGCIRAKWWCSGKRSSILAKVVVFVQSLYSGKVVIFGQKLLQSG